MRGGSCGFVEQSCCAAAARTGLSGASTEASHDLMFVRPNAAMRFRLLTWG